MVFKEPRVEFITLEYSNTIATSEMGSNVCQGTDYSLNHAAYCAETLDLENGLDKSTVCQPGWWNPYNDTFTPT